MYIGLGDTKRSFLAKRKGKKKKKNGTAFLEKKYD